ncbi:substrate-binding periplasmic protein [Cellvibrio japonicus]|nr:transporter substrate-binding domain-containing protein [Cellvibrio japonicus]QEI12917.1 amino acid ABC transporter substrate-binding protein [Cellvibrio japonicus]QEI16491.1 amino acid ABC transporter substrate-binding protein [Cellvibrio japonicus]QEI20069.1 amino acid ABC transporter substrate-binding protein [Cellvibrio japonicus]
MNLRRHRLWLMLCLSLAFTAMAESPGGKPVHIRLGAENSWPPYSDEQGLGISTNLVRAAFSRRGIEPSFYVQPYARVLHDLKAGKIDGGYNVTLQESTRHLYIFGREPLLVLKSYWYFQPGQHPDIKRLEDIPEGFRVGVIIDYEYGDAYEAVRSHFREIKVSQQAQLIRLLKQGRIDAALMFEQEAEYALNKLEIPIATLDKRFLSHRGGVYVAFSRKNPQARWLARELDKGLQALKESGEYAQLITVTPP